MPRRRYPSDLTGCPVDPPRTAPPRGSAGGRPRAHPTRDVIDALRYVLRGGIAWRVLPHDYPPWQTVYHSFRAWRLDGTWEWLNDERRALVRGPSRAHRQPSAAILDSQSAKTTERGPRGDDGAKKAQRAQAARARDTLGLLLTVVVHPADVSDRDGAVQVLEHVPTRYPRLAHLWVDAGYAGKTVTWIEQTPRADGHRGAQAAALDPGAGRPGPPPMPRWFQVSPRRWVVERTFAWLGRYRRLSKDDEALPATEEARIYLAMSSLMLAGLAK